MWGNYWPDVREHDSSHALHIRTGPRVQDVGSQPQRFHSCGLLGISTSTKLSLCSFKRKHVCTKTVHQYWRYCVDSDSTDGEWNWETNYHSLQTLQVLSRRCIIWKFRPLTTEVVFAWICWFVMEMARLQSCVWISVDVWSCYYQVAVLHMWWSFHPCVYSKVVSGRGWPPWGVHALMVDDLTPS